MTQAEIQNLWEHSESLVYKVLDADGNNPGEAVVRQHDGGQWLYYDQIDGYQLLEDATVQQLILA